MGLSASCKAGPLATAKVILETVSCECILQGGSAWFVCDAYMIYFDGLQWRWCQGVIGVRVAWCKGDACEGDAPSYGGWVAGAVAKLERIIPVNTFITSITLSSNSQDIQRIEFLFCCATVSWNPSVAGCRGCCKRPFHHEGDGHGIHLNYYEGAFWIWKDSLSEWVLQTFYGDGG